MKKVIYLISLIFVILGCSSNTPKIVKLNNMLVSPESITVDKEENIYLIDLGLYRKKVYEITTKYIVLLESIRNDLKHIEDKVQREIEWEISKEFQERLKRGEITSSQLNQEYERMKKEISIKRDRIIELYKRKYLDKIRELEKKEKMEKKQVLKGVNGIKKFDKNGNFIKEFGELSNGILPIKIGVDGNNILYIVGKDMQGEYRIVKYDINFNFLGEVKWKGNEELFYPTKENSIDRDEKKKNVIKNLDFEKMKIDLQGNIYIPYSFTTYLPGKSIEHHYLLKFDKYGNFMKRFLGNDLNINFKKVPFYIDNYGNIYISIFKNNILKIIKLNPKGNFSKEISININKYRKIPEFVVNDPLSYPPVANFWLDKKGFFCILSADIDNLTKEEREKMAKISEGKRKEYPSLPIEDSRNIASSITDYFSLVMGKIHPKIIKFDENNKFINMFRIGDNEQFQYIGLLINTYDHYGNFYTMIKRKNIKKDEIVIQKYSSDGKLLLEFN